MAQRFALGRAGEGIPQAGCAVLAASQHGLAVRAENRPQSRLNSLDPPARFRMRQQHARWPALVEVPDAGFLIAHRQKALAVRAEDRGVDLIEMGQRRPERLSRLGVP